jgi:hypothetical protein
MRDDPSVAEGSPGEKLLGSPVISIRGKIEVASFEGAYLAREVSGDG